MTATDMKFTTWEEAARWAAENMENVWPLPYVNALSWVEQYYGDSKWRSVLVFGTAGLLTARGLRSADTSFVDEAVAHLAAKQHDYGHDNILRFGIEGVKVRIWDKIARLKNLLAKGADAKNEALEDTWLDIVGYAVIAIMLENGVFELPLAADAPKRTVVKLAYRSSVIKDPFYFKRGDPDATTFTAWADAGFNLFPGSPIKSITLRLHDDRECEFYLAEVEA